MAEEARRSAGAALGLSLILGLTFSLSAASAAAQQEAGRAASVCDVPADQFTSPVSLPHVTAALKKSDKKLNILTIGSPIGVGRGPRKSYSAALESLLEKALTGIDVIIVNRPVSGEIAATATERIKTEVALSRPDLLIWQVGANDALARVPPEQFEQALGEGVRWAKEAGVDVLLIGFEANPWLHDDQQAGAIRDATAKVAQAENVAYLRRYDAMQFIARTRSRVEQGDQPFPAQVGDECMAELVAKALVANIVLRRTRPAPLDP